MAIHESAIVDPSAKIHKYAEICAYTVIGANVEIGVIGHRVQPCV
jgi:UDP-N-acetylglucosamine acyltransferase